MSSYTPWEPWWVLCLQRLCSKKQRNSRFIHYVFGERKEKKMIKKAIVAVLLAILFFPPKPPVIIK
jgi:hypothetical protein